MTIREVTEHVFDSPEETLKSQRQRRQKCIRVPGFTQSGLKLALYAIFVLAFPSHGDPLRPDFIAVFCPLIWIITGKYEMMARKPKKADAQMTAISVSADGILARRK